MLGLYCSVSFQLTLDLNRKEMTNTMNPAKMNPLLTRVLAGAALAILANMATVARAQLYDSDWKVSGDEQILNDGSSGLQWLGLDETAGLSYNQVAAQFGAGGTFAGFGFATVSQVDTLFADAGIPDVDAGFEGTAANVPGVTSLLGLWHADIAGSFEASSGPFGYFLTSDEGTGLIWIPMGSYGDTGTAEATDGPARLAGISGEPDYSISYLASALVRTGVAPVPDGASTASMLGCALAGLAMLRRKFRM